MMEELESRTFFSATPMETLTALRADVAGIGHTITAITVANKAAIANLQNDMSIFPTATTTDHATLVAMNLQFRLQVSTLANDFNNVKVLLGQDITQLINRTNAYNRHPVFAVGQAVQASEQLLLSQGNTAVNTLTEDASLMQMSYQRSLEIIATSHPLDATLNTRVSNVSTGFSLNTSAIHNTAAAVAQADIPSLIASLEPNGVNSAAV